MWMCLTKTTYSSPFMTMHTGAWLLSANQVSLCQNSTVQLSGVTALGECGMSWQESKHSHAFPCQTDLRFASGHFQFSMFSCWHGALLCCRALALQTSAGSRERTAMLGCD